MNVIEQWFNWPNVHLEHYYIYFVISFFIAFYLVVKSNVSNKIELFFLSFYLLTGSLNKLLTIAIPGFSLFEIRPSRFLFFLFSFFLIRKVFFSREKIILTINGKIPWFEVMLYAYVFLSIVSQFAYISSIGLTSILLSASNALNFLFIIFSLRIMANEESYNLIGKSILIGATFSSIISIIQFSVDPFFLRIGDDRLAFGGLLRANGIFDAEQSNSYFLITAIVWALFTLKSNVYRIALVCLFSIGVMTTFHRMSWLILISIHFLYFIFIEKIAFEKLVLAGLSGIAALLIIFNFYYTDIMDTSLVKDRLSDSVESRAGYYSMVIDNIGDKPLFGYGGTDNEVYYSHMLKIKKSRERATGQEGGIHSGYFSAMFYYGIPAFICFTLFVILSVFYYAKLITEDIFFAIPFLIAFLYLVGNLTNTLYFSKYVSILYAIHLGIAMGVKRIKNLS